MSINTNDYAILLLAENEKLKRERDDLKRNQELNLKIKQAMHARFTRAELERDELRAIAEEQSKLAGSNAARAQKAEAEITRRDAAAGGSGWSNLLRSTMKKIIAMSRMMK